MTLWESRSDRLLPSSQGLKSFKPLIWVRACLANRSGAWQCIRFSDCRGRAMVGMRRGELMDGAWTAIAPLLPCNGQLGQQWRDHRQVINGIL